MKNSAKDICNLFRKFGGDTNNYQEIQQRYIGERARESWPIVKAMEKSRAKPPKLKSLSATQTVVTPALVKSANSVRRPNAVATTTRIRTGDFQSKNHPAGINLRALATPVPDSPQPGQFTKDAPLSVVFSRLMKQQDVARSPVIKLWGWLGLVK